MVIVGVITSSIRAYCFDAGVQLGGFTDGERQHHQSKCKPVLVVYYTPLCIDQRIHSLCVAQNVWRIMQETVERGKPEVGRQLLSQVQKVDRELFRDLGVRWNKLMDTLKID